MLGFLSHFLFYLLLNDYWHVLSLFMSLPSPPHLSLSTDDLASYFRKETGQKKSFHRLLALQLPTACSGIHTLFLSHGCERTRLFKCFIILSSYQFSLPLTHCLTHEKICLYFSPPQNNPCWAP